MSINPEVIRTRCQEILDSVERLERLGQEPPDRFLADQDLQDIACHRLQVAIEAALALCYHLAAKKLHQVPEEYAECFTILEVRGALPPTLAENLRKMARFRNLLVHMYWKIDYQAVWDIIHTRLDDLREFTGLMAAEI